MQGKKSLFLNNDNVRQMIIATMFKNYMQFHGVLFHCGGLYENSVSLSDVSGMCCRTFSKKWRSADENPVWCHGLRGGSASWMSRFWASISWVGGASMNRKGLGGKRMGLGQRHGVRYEPAHDRSHIQVRTNSLQT